MKNNISKEAGGNHYGAKLQPWDLTRCMESTGNAHIDGCRCSIIKYAFRLKGSGDAMIPKLIDDLEKVAHYATEAVRILKERLADRNQPELDLVFGQNVCPICSEENGHDPKCTNKKRFEFPCSTCGGGEGEHDSRCIHYTCPICDGGPGNHCVCKCPK